MSKTLIVDYSGVMFRCAFVAWKLYQKELADLNSFSGIERFYSIYRTIFFDDIFEHVRREAPDRVIMAMDSGQHWRKEIYPRYKEKRKKSRDESPIDFDSFFPIHNEFTKEFKNVFTNFFFIKENNCEADDVIAILCKNIFQNDEITIVSVDGDLDQLLTNQNIKRFSPMSKSEDKYIKSPDPKKQLELKILIGDSSDNIPNIMVLDEEKFPIAGNRIGLGPATAENILKEEKFLESDFVLEKVNKKYKNISKQTIIDNLKSNYQRNLKLISLDYIPEELKNKIIDNYKNYQLKNIDFGSLFSFCNKVNRADFLGEVHRLEKSLKLPER